MKRLVLDAPVAQGIERRIPNPQVAGSIPAGGTKEIKRLAYEFPHKLTVESTVF